MWSGPVPGSLCPLLLQLPSGPVEQSKPGLRKILIIFLVSFRLLLAGASFVGFLVLTARLGLIGVLGLSGLLGSTFTVVT